MGMRQTSMTRKLKRNKLIHGKWCCIWRNTAVWVDAMTTPCVPSVNQSCDAQHPSRAKTSARLPHLLISCWHSWLFNKRLSPAPLTLNATWYCKHQASLIATLADVDSEAHPHPNCHLINGQVLVGMCGAVPNCDHSVHRYKFGREFLPVIFISHTRIAFLSHQMTFQMYSVELSLPILLLY